MKKLLNWLASAFVLFVFSLMVSFVCFFFLLGAVQVHKEKQANYFFEQYHIDKTKKMLEGRINLP